MQAQQATLVMESRGLAPQVRSFHFTDLWSRLYKTDDYFLDITCKPEGELSQLSGHIMLSSGLEPEESANIILYKDNQEITQAGLDDFGQFKLDVDMQGTFDLEVQFGDARITVPQLTIQ